VLFFHPPPCVYYCITLRAICPGAACRRDIAAVSALNAEPQSERSDPTKRTTVSDIIVRGARAVFRTPERTRQLAHTPAGARSGAARENIDACGGGWLPDG
jgi:hypothetical protein